MAPVDTTGLRLASRRDALKGAAAATVASAFGFPAIVRAQETIKLGVLQPLSGGLEVLGQQGVQGVRSPSKRRTRPAACSMAARSSW